MAQHRVMPMMTTTVRGNNNPGDTFIGVGLQWLWEHALDKDISWYLVNKHNPNEIKNCLDIIKNAGFLIYGGMPQYNRYSDWKFWYDDGFWSEFINPNKIPVAVMAGGSGYPDASMTPKQFAHYCMQDLETREIIKRRTEHALCFTTRDEHSHRLLNKLHIANEYIACSATFASRYANIQQRDNRPYIGLVPPGPSALPDKYCVKDQAAQFVVHQWMELFYKLKKQGQNPKVICHFKHEYELFKELLSDKSLFYSNDYHSYLEFFGKCHTVVSARLHGVLPAFGIPGTKALGISIDTRGHAVTYFDKIPALTYDEFNADKVISMLPSLKPSEESDFKPVIDKYKAVILDAYGKVY